jgi:quercetin dioxygenase-like cupin family protein
MRIQHGRDGRPSEERGPTFTGPVWADPVLAGVDGVVVNTVMFPPGSRTYWHTHGTGQILFVTHGRGYALTAGGRGGELLPGDVVWFEAGERHWHGAAPDSYLTHTAVSLGGTDWEEAVSDADYAAAATAGG